MNISNKLVSDNYKTDVDNQLQIGQIIAPNTQYDTVQNTIMGFLDIPPSGWLKNIYILCNVTGRAVDGSPLGTGVKTDPTAKVILDGCLSQCIEHVDVMMNNASVCNLSNAGHYFGILDDLHPKHNRPEGLSHYNPIIDSDYLDDGTP